MQHFIQKALLSMCFIRDTKTRATKNKAQAVDACLNPLYITEMNILNYVTLTDISAETVRQDAQSGIVAENVNNSKQQKKRFLLLVRCLHPVVGQQSTVYTDKQCCMLIKYLIAINRATTFFNHD